MTDTLMNSFQESLKQEIISLKNELMAKIEKIEKPSTYVDKNSRQLCGFITRIIWNTGKFPAKSQPHRTCYRKPRRSGVTQSGISIIEDTNYLCSTDNTCCCFCSFDHTWFQSSGDTRFWSSGDTCSSDDTRFRSSDDTRSSDNIWFLYSNNSRSSDDTRFLSSNNSRSSDDTWYAPALGSAFPTTPVFAQTDASNSASSIRPVPLVPATTTSMAFTDKDVVSKTYWSCGGCPAQFGFILLKKTFDNDTLKK